MALAVGTLAHFVSSSFVLHTFSKNAPLLLTHVTTSVSMAPSFLLVLLAGLASASGGGLEDLQLLKDTEQALGVLTQVGTGEKRLHRMENDNVVVFSPLPPRTSTACT